MQTYHRSNNKHLNFNIHYLCKVDHPFSTTRGISDSGWPLDSEIWRGGCAGVQDSKTAPTCVLLFLAKRECSTSWLATSQSSTTPNTRLLGPFGVEGLERPPRSPCPRAGPAPPGSKPLVMLGVCCSACASFKCLCGLLV